MSHLIYNHVCHLLKKCSFQILITAIYSLNNIENNFKCKINTFWNYFSGEFCISVDCGKDVTRKDVFLDQNNSYNDPYNEYEISFEDCILKGILSFCSIAFGMHV